MGLSNENPKVTVATLVAIAEIAKTLELFKQYGIEKLISDAHKLSEAEIKKRDEAVASISKYESLIAESKQRQKQLDDTSAQHVATVSALNAERQKLSEKEGELNQREKELGKRDEENRKAKDALNERERALDVRQSKIEENEAVAATARKEAEKHAADLQARLEKMKGIAAGA